MYLEQERDYTVTLRLMTIYGAYITDKAQFYSYRLEWFRLSLIQTDYLGILLMFERDALVAQLGEPYTNQVVARFNRFAFIRDELLENIVASALSETWGNDNFVLKYYLAVHVAWSVEQGNFTHCVLLQDLYNGLSIAIYSFHTGTTAKCTI
ncbi:hypothetical protein [Nodularia spumigena]|uniref:hypothetical protein n=1 Tax=Nodularia spumigena TaxID=70799 RepID=UPI00232ACC06|nr:hypothetical protein [Nodularia spumigena]